VNEVGRAKFRHEGGYHVAEEHHAFGHVSTDKVKSGGENNDVEDIVDESW
jgi:hypothetical protein